MDQARRDTCALAVMAKAPRNGEVKTRLVPPLHVAEAAALSACFLKDIAANFMAAAETVPIAGFIAYSPPGSEALFRDLVPPEIGLLPPRSVGLANSLPDAVEDLLGAGYGGVCLVNADSPTLPTSVLVEAVRALQAPGDRVVLGPAFDGGYYLIGLKRLHRRLFEDIAWSTERVFRQTMERAQSIALDTVTLPSWYDVDDAASLEWLCREILGGRRPPGCARPGYAAPDTSAYLQSLAAAGYGRRLGLEALGIDALGIDTLGTELGAVGHVPP
ncbi:hypothetical protein GCM10011611_59280 [Aliidongia dinghuensis]|uniref:Glycosyltransferase n=1 Tax=Aliidongia dinghuensis TaxID=1867774 RepID=A0A8J2YZY1_9PROT|nr:TIGR04282 family arsenosugar biosynthesis glycosyltransferase [Aliidongia dinghuensis]GGF44997.1 hypothetical protein GCM10011611_59280 [Aliidongia dinghuensis]